MTRGCPIPIMIYSSKTKSSFSLTGLAKKIPYEEISDLESFVNQIEETFGGKLVKYAFNTATAVSVAGLVGSIANYYGADISKEIVTDMNAVGGTLSFIFGGMHLYGNIDTSYARKRIAERKNLELNLPATQNHHPDYDTNPNTNLSNE